MAAKNVIVCECNFELQSLSIFQKLSNQFSMSLFFYFSQRQPTRKQPLCCAPRELTVFTLFNDTHNDCSSFERMISNCLSSKLALLLSIVPNTSNPVMVEMGYCIFNIHNPLPPWMRAYLFFLPQKRLSKSAFTPEDFHKIWVYL